MSKSKTSYNKVKTSIKNWILEIDKTEQIPADIIAFSFNLYEPYGIELVGTKWFDEENEDWACDEEYRPLQKKWWYS